MFYRVIPCRGRSNLYGLRRSQSSNFRVADYPSCQCRQWTIGPDKVTAQGCRLGAFYT